MLDVSYYLLKYIALPAAAAAVVVCLAGVAGACVLRRARIYCTVYVYTPSVFSVCLGLEIVSESRSFPSL